MLLFSLRARCTLRVFLSCASSDLMSYILRSMCRRSVSSFFSPGPRVPIPPPSLESDFPNPVSLGILYASCASSTCSLPSFDVARLAKISSIRIVRSITRTPTASSRFRSCIPVSSSLKMTVSASMFFAISASSSTFPFPIKVAVFGRSRF